MRKVVYETVKRPTIEAEGVQNVKVVLFAKDGSIESTSSLGFIHRAFRSKEFKAMTVDAKLYGVFGTRAQAGESLKKLHDGKDPSVKTVDGVTTGGNLPTAADEPTEASLDDVLNGTLMTMDEALAKLDISKDALRKRIKRGTVKTAVVDGTTFVVLN